MSASAKGPIGPPQGPPKELLQARPHAPRLIKSTRGQTPGTDPDRTIETNPGTISSHESQLVWNASLQPEPTPAQLETFKLWTSLKEMQTQASNASAEAQAAKTESAVLAARIQQLQQELHFIQQSAERRQEDFKTLKQLESSWSERTALQAQQMSVLQAECERLKTLIAQTVQEKSAEQQHLKELCEDLKRQLDEKIRECENLAHSADLTLKAEVLISREQAVKEQTTKQQHHDTVLRSQWHWLKKHQQRLIAYRNQLTEEEAELKHIASKLAQELKISGAVHPLQDYLKMTDLELSKIELELKKLPGSSMDRPHFEAVLTQLTEQRNFLRSTIETTQQTLQKRTQIVLKIAGEDLLNAHKTAAPEWNPPQGE